ncbi:MAG: serine/threonine-protein kinase [Enhygromyxa sp.]
MTTTTFEPPTIGDVLGEGRFELLARLGDGGTSIVFRARDRFLDREVALKLLHPRYVGRPEREQRLINEAEYLRRVQGHPHIIEYIDSGRLRDLHAWPWLATEVLHGTVLGWVLVRGRLGVPRTLSVARQILEALRACHAAGLVHRDTTPNNLFQLDDGETVKLFDFSHAADFRGPKLAVGAPERLTGVFDVPGTHGYMGPEQVQQDFADPSMDVFGFGILLYELVTGKNPYANLSERGAFIKAQRDGTLKPPRLHAWAYQAPEELEQLVHDCTQREPEQRPTIDALVERLAALEAQLGDEAATRVHTPVREEAATKVHTPARDEAATKLHTPAREEAATQLHTPARDQAPHWGPPPSGVVEATVKMDVAPASDHDHDDHDHEDEKDEATARVDARELAQRHAKPKPSEEDEATARVDALELASRHAKPEQPEVTATVDVPAVVGIRRELSGDWISRNQQAAAPATAAVAAAPAPELEPPGGEASHTPVALAFARPPELRESAPKIEREPEGEVVQLVPPPSPTPEPEVHSQSDDPGPVAGGRGWLWALGGLAVALVAGTWIWLQGRPDQSHDRTDQIDQTAEEIPAEPNPTKIAPLVPDEPALEPVPEVEPESEVETTAGAEPEVETTAGVEPDPEPEPEPGHKPDSGHKSNPKPKHNPKTESDPRPESLAPECKDIEKKTRDAASKRDWKTVLEYTGRSKCWSSKRTRQKFEVLAYANTGQWSKCVAAGEGSRDPDVQRRVEACKDSL